MLNCVLAVSARQTWGRTNFFPLCFSKSKWPIKNFSITASTHLSVVVVCSFYNPSVTWRSNAERETETVTNSDWKWKCILLISMVEGIGLCWINTLCELLVGLALMAAFIYLIGEESAAADQAGFGPLSTASVDGLSVQIWERFWEGAQSEVELDSKPEGGRMATCWP